MNAREELYALSDIIGDKNPAAEKIGKRAAAQRVLAAGYRKSRTIDDWAELAKAHMTVVRTSAGIIANIVNGRAYCFGYESSAPVDSLALPVTVLYEPEPQP